MEHVTDAVPTALSGENQKDFPMWGRMKKLMLNLLYPPIRKTLDEQMADIHREHLERAREIETLLEIGECPRYWKHPKDFAAGALKPPEDLR